MERNICNSGAVCLRQAVRQMIEGIPGREFRINPLVAASLEGGQGLQIALRPSAHFCTTGIEFCDDRGRKGRELFECCHDWHSGQRPGSFRAMYGVKLIWAFTPFMISPSTVSPVALTLTQSAVGRIDSCFKQPFMLPHNVETMEGPKQVIAFLVRLERSR